MHTGQPFVLYKYVVDERNRHGDLTYAFVLLAEDQVVGAWLFAQAEVPGLYPANMPVDQHPLPHPLVAPARKPFIHTVPLAIRGRE